MPSLLEQLSGGGQKGSIKDLVFPVSNTYDFIGKDRVVFINTGDIHEGEFLHKNYSDVQKLPGQAKKTIEKGDILFSEIRPKNRHFALVDFDAPDYVVSTKLMVLKVRPGVDPKFAYIVLTSDATLKALQEIAESRSGTFPQITFDTIADFEIPLPDLSTQKRIAEVLGAYDEKIQTNQTVIKNLESTAKTLFDEWFVKFNFPGHEKVGLVESEQGEIPEGWFVSSITDIASRLSAPKMYKEENLAERGLIPVYDQSSKGIIGFHNEEPSFVASIADPILIFGDHTCRVQMVRESFSLGPNTIPLGKKNGYSLAFVFFLIKDLIVQKEYKRHWNELVSFKLVVPPSELTQSFAVRINPLIEGLTHSEKENIILKKSRDALLSKLL